MFFLRREKTFLTVPARKIPARGKEFTNISAFKTGNKTESTIIFVKKQRYQFS